MAIQVCESFKFTVITGTTDAIAGTEKAFAHGLKDIPEFYTLKPTSNGIIYESTAADATNIYLKASINSATFEAVCYKRSLEKVL